MGEAVSEETTFRQGIIAGCVFRLVGVEGAVVALVCDVCGMSFGMAEATVARVAVLVCAVAPAAPPPPSPSAVTATIVVAVRQRLWQW